MSKTALRQKAAYTLIPMKGFSAICTGTEKKEDAELIPHQIKRPSSTWTYTLRPDELPGFKLSLAAMPIGVKAAAAVILAPAVPFYILSRFLKKRAEHHRSHRPVEHR